MKLSALAALERRLLNAKTDAERREITARLRELARQQHPSEPRETR